MLWPLCCGNIKSTNCTLIGNRTEYFIVPRMVRYQQEYYMIQKYAKAKTKTKKNIEDNISFVMSTLNCFSFTQILQIKFKHEKKLI